MYRVSFGWIDWPSRPSTDYGVSLITMLGYSCHWIPAFGLNGAALASPRQGAKLPGISGAILFLCYSSGADLDIERSWLDWWTCQPGNHMRVAIWDGLGLSRNSRAFWVMLPCFLLHSIVNIGKYSELLTQSNFYTLLPIAMNSA